MSSSPLNLPALPATLKPIAHPLKTAAEHATRDPVVTYWCRLSALQSALKLDKTSKEAKMVLLPLMDWLEKEKKILSQNEAITNEVVASAHIENYAMKLFSYADKEDREGHFNKNVVKAFYTSGMLFDVLAVFGEVTPENAHARKYAKWKAAYIHNCLKNGETPIPGPAATGEEEEIIPEWQQPQIPGSDPMAPPEPESSPKPTPAPRAKAIPPPPSDAETVEESAECGGGLTPEQIAQTKKYCKYASSAVDYDDRATAIDNLQKALRLLQTGRDG